MDQWKDISILNAQFVVVDKNEVLKIFGISFGHTDEKEIMCLSMNKMNPAKDDILIVFNRADVLVEMIQSWLDEVKGRIN